MAQITGPDMREVFGKLLGAGSIVQATGFANPTTALGQAKIWGVAELAKSSSVIFGGVEGSIMTNAKKRDVVVKPAPVPKPDEDPPAQTSAKSTNKQ